MIGFEYSGEVPRYLGNEIYPAVLVFLHRAEEKDAWKVLVPRVTYIQFGDHATIATQTLCPSLGGRALHSTFAAPSLHVHEPARLIVWLARDYASPARPAYVLRIEAPYLRLESGKFRGPDEYAWSTAAGWRAHTHEPGDPYERQHGPNSHTHDLVTGKMDTLMGEPRPAEW